MVLVCLLVATVSLFGVKQEKKITAKNKDILLPCSPVKKDVLFPAQMFKLGMFLVGPNICNGKNNKSLLKLEIMALQNGALCTL